MVVMGLTDSFAAVAPFSMHSPRNAQDFQNNNSGPLFSPPSYNVEFKEQAAAGD
jgi:hypothetical protein